MANIFPKNANWVPIKLVVALSCLGATGVFGVAYYFTPEYARVGYEPIQPVEFQHSLHVEQLGMDCRYCHFGVESSYHSNVPNTQVCMTCHKQVRLDSAKLQPVRDSWETGQSIPWVRLHQTPDYAYFNHAIHVNSGISCVHCHGQVNQMDEVYHAKSLSMGFCLECHRNPEQYLRPLEHVYDLDWKAASPAEQQRLGKELVETWKIHAPETCAACHR